MRKRARIRAGLAAVALVAGAGAGIAATAAPASAGTVRGVDVQQACLQQYANRISLAWLVYTTVKASNPWSWECWDGSPFPMGGVSMATACRMQHGSPWPYTYLVWPYNAYDWRCV